MNYKILLVDDHTLVRKGIKGLLLTHYPGLEIQEAENGVQAILACSTVKQDIVLMDYDMPKLDGLTASIQILKDSPDVRILMVSMHDGPELVARLQECGVMGLLHKNVGDAEFLQAITRVRQGIRHFPVTGSSDGPIRTGAPSRKKTMKSGLHSLTSREAEIFRLLAAGQQPAAIAASLSISVKTLDTHKMSIFRKCGVHSIPELVRFAFMNNAV